MALAPRSALLMDALEKEGSGYLIKPWVPSSNPKCPALGLKSMPDLFWIRCYETIVVSYQGDDKKEETPCRVDFEELPSHTDSYNG